METYTHIVAGPDSSISFPYVLLYGIRYRNMNGAVPV